MVNPFDDLVADPITGSIRPWYAIKHEMGRTLNFPLNLGNLQIDKDLFIAQFVDNQYEANTHFKSFMEIAVGCMQPTIDPAGPIATARTPVAIGYPSLIAHGKKQ